VQGLRPQTLLARERFDYGAGKDAGITSDILVVALHVACRQLMTESSTASIPLSLTPQKTQKNQSGQHFRPNLFLGRWLKGLAANSKLTQPIMKQ